MNIVHIINLVNFILDKEWSGRTFTPDQFNDVIAFVNEEIFKEEFDRLTGISIQTGELYTREMVSLIDDSLLSPFKKLHSGDGPGVIAIPGDYKKKLSAKIKYATKPIGPVRHIEWVSEYELQRRASIVSRKDPYQYPYGLIREPTLIWVPKNVATVDFIYLRQPLTPYVDWCVLNSSGKTILLEPDWQIFNDGGVLNVLDENSFVKYPDVTYHTPVPVGELALSLSVNPEYDQMYYIMIVNRMLEKAGIRIGDNKVYEYSQRAIQQGE